MLRTQDMRDRVDAHQAILYVAKHVQMNQYLRDPKDIDAMVTQGYHVLLDGLHCYADNHHIELYMLPENAVRNNVGYSYFNDAKFKGKSKALVDFFAQDKPGC